MTGVTRYQVRLSVPRIGGWRAWGAVSEEFERRLAEQQSPAVAVHLDSWVRRGRDYLQMVIQMVIVATVGPVDVAEALELACRPSARRQTMTPDGTWPPPRPRSAPSVRECCGDGRPVVVSRANGLMARAGVFMAGAAGVGRRKTERPGLRFCHRACEPAERR
jgi:hypothetical protein